MAYSDKVIDHYENREMSVLLTKKTLLSAPVWSAHRLVVM